LNRPSDLLGALRQCQPGQSVSLLVLRGAQWLAVTVSLQAEPDAEERARQALIGVAAANLDGLVKAGGGRSLPDGFLQPAGFLGHALLLEFGASHCPPCRLLAPEVARWHDRYAARGLSVIAVAEEPVEPTLRWALAQRIPYAVGADPEGTVAGRYWISDLPTLVLVGKTGVVEDVLVGFAPESFPRLVASIERALAPPEPRVPPPSGPPGTAP
jgi:thiol-disulfide isomerase/thioredoxin